MGRRLTDYPDEDHLKLAGRPEVYTALDLDDLERLLGYTIAIYGGTRDPELILTLLPLYRYWAGKVAPWSRMNVYREVLQCVLSGQISAQALLPFLRVDSDSSVVSTATVDLAMLWPIKNDDPLTGPKTIVAMISKGEMENPAGALAGLLLLGDHRVNQLLWDLRDFLENSGLGVVAGAGSGYLSASTIEFWLKWLEEIVDDPDKEGTFGVIAAALTNSVEALEVPMVIEAERNFCPPSPDHGVRVLSQWTLSEYFERMRPRLMALSERESEPKLIPHVIAAWAQATPTRQRVKHRRFWPF